MDRGAAVLLTAAAGGFVALQAPINSGLGRAIGTFQAAFLSFLLGTLVLLAIVIVAGGGLGPLRGVPGAGVVYLLGGVLGAVYVTTVLVTVRTLGAGGVVAATIAGQLTMSLVVDQLGILGVERAPVRLPQLLGVAFLALGVLLIVRD